MKRFARRGISIVALLLVLVMGTSILTSAAMNPKQTAATTDTVTISWTAVPDAAHYVVSYYPKGNSGDATIKTINAPKTTCTIQLPKDKIYYAETFALNEQGDFIDESNYYAPIAVAPGQISGYNPVSWGNGKGGSFKLKKNPYPNTLMKVEWRLLSRDGKTIKAKGTTSSMGFSAPNIRTNQVYKLAVRGCVRVEGKEFYGPWHYKKVVPQPKLKKLKLARKNRIKVSWGKVAGANKYIVYASTHPTKGYKKVATVKGSKTSYVVSKVRGKKIVKNKKYYFKVRAISGSTKSITSNYRYGYIY